ncbi:MAG: M23 family metallopeptidase [bacterium]
MDRKALELCQQMQKNQFVPGTEQFEVCRKALNYLGSRYERTEELGDTTIDCSTLVSQSYWEGALIGIPFTAEKQRQAFTGLNIDSISDAIPSDVLIKYPSLDNSPDKTFNHVGIYLWSDNAGQRWVIESKGGIGVILSHVEDFDPQGGIKRFSLSSDIHNQSLAYSALRLARYVPKFGRLGVRQYRYSTNQRMPHTGIDIYVPAKTSVYSTVSGTAKIVTDEIECSVGVEISNEDSSFKLCYMMLEQIQCDNNDLVVAGQLLGYTTYPSPRSDIRYCFDKEQASHLHLEYMIFADTLINIQGKIRKENFICENHLYLSKIGKLPLPFKVNKN